MKPDIPSLNGESLSVTSLLAFARASMELRQWYEDVVQQNWRLLFSVAYDVLRNVTDAEEARQRASLNGWRAIKRLKSPEFVVSWLVRITKNVSIDMLRDRAHDKRAVSIEDPSIYPAPKIAEGLEPEEIQRVRDAIAELPLKQELVVRMRFYEGLQLEEVARRLGIAGVAARVRLHRALKKLKTILEVEAPR